ncbi:ester cyclase [Sphaerisporangium sp. NPDC051017]|uniref:ester cyclase n=1 Tax=unclassified Sphaerisporangium TaxID=2630420 RepID=UPI0033FCED17
MSELLYQRFAQLFNARELDRLDEVMTEDFVDHHPGLVDVEGLSIYQTNLGAVIDALQMVAHPEEIVATGDRVFTRIRLTGRHVGPFLGVAPTGNALEWYTHELWRVENGRFAERWAVDDLLTLLRQIDVPLPTWVQDSAPVS